MIHLRNVSFGHGGVPLVENIQLSLNEGEHIALIGRNGVGKSSFFKLIQGDIVPNQGQIVVPSHLSIAFLSQTVPDDIQGSVFDYVASALQTLLDEPWQIQHRVEAILSKLNLPLHSDVSVLSGGLKRRVLLAKALVLEPDLLLLDEPTNHLDIDSILWLEHFLKKYSKAFILITHDRSLMQAVASHIIEIDNGQLYSWRGHYEDYLKYKANRLASEEKANTLFDKRLAQEEVWIRQGIKARRTRNEGRVRALKTMREERQARRIRPGQITLQHQRGELSGKVVLDVNSISFTRENETIIRDFSTVILRGDKIGIIGPNGSGKSTLLNLLLGKLTPTSGTIKTGTKLKVAYFDQQRMQLDETKTIIENVAGGSDFIEVGKEKKHVIGYLQDFLFSPEQARRPLSYLSGGERNRVMLAKVFATPCNVLVLDEPTNDLDVETLELLEDLLLDYKATLLLVSHDRSLLNNVVTSTLVMEGNGYIGDYVGGYDDALRHQKPSTNDKVISKEKKKTKKSRTNKLSADEQRELKTLPKTIETLEAKISTLQTQLSDPNLYKTNPEECIAAKQALANAMNELDVAFERWETLEKQR